MNLNNLISSLGFKSNLAGDVSFLILFLLVSFVLSIALGKHRILVTMLGTYASYTAISLLPKNMVDSASTKVIFFIAVLAAFVLFFGRIIRANLSGSGAVYLAKSIIGAAIILGFTLSIVFSWLPGKDLAEFSTPATRAYFTGELYRFIWALAPLVYLAVVRKRID